MAKKTPAEFALAQALKELPVAPLIEYRAQIAWKDGLPYLVSAPVRLSEDPVGSMPALIRKCLDLPYDGPDLALAGLTQGEAMIVNMVREAANGGEAARDTVLNRILGHPKTKSESVVISGNLNDFLDSVAKKEKLETVDITIEPEPDSVEDL
jgi:hypothetical protein